MIDFIPDDDEEGDDLPADSSAATPGLLTARTTTYYPGERHSDPDTDAGRTSTGGPLIPYRPGMAGTVAVDPKKYAYGTIFKRPDGSVYVAADTGGAVKSMKASGGRADVLDFASSTPLPDYEQVQVIPPTLNYLTLSPDEKAQYHRDAAATHGGAGGGIQFVPDEESASIPSAGANSQGIDFRPDTPPSLPATAVPPLPGTLAIQPAPDDRPDVPLAKPTLAQRLAGDAGTALSEAGGNVAVGIPRAIRSAQAQYDESQPKPQPAGTDLAARRAEITARLAEIDDAEAHADAPSAPDPERQRLYNELATLTPQGQQEATKTAQSATDARADAATLGEAQKVVREGFEHTKPGEKVPLDTKIAEGIGGTISALTPGGIGLASIAANSSNAARDAAEQAAKDAGAQPDEAREAGDKAATKSLVKTAAMIPVLMATGGAGGGLASRLTPDSAGIVRQFLMRTAGATAGNVVGSSLIRAAEGEPIKPTLEGVLGSDLPFALAHAARGGEQPSQRPGRIESKESPDQTTPAPHLSSPDSIPKTATGIDFRPDISTEIDLRRALAEQGANTPSSTPDRGEPAAERPIQTQPAREVPAFADDPSLPADRPAPELSSQTTEVEKGTSTDQTPAPSENQPELVSTKIAAVDEARAKRGLEPIEPTARQDFGTAWDKAKAKLAAEPNAGRNLVDELNGKPRALNDEENAVLLHRQIDAQVEFDAANDEVINARPDTLDAAKLRLDRATNELFDVHTAARVAGAETGRGLNARKMLAAEDYSLSKMLVRRRAANDGKPLNENQSAQVREAHAKISELENKISAHEAEIAKLNARRTRQPAGTAREATAEARKAPGRRKTLTSFLDTKAEEARARIVARRGNLTFNTGINPLEGVARFADESIIGASHIANGVKRFGEWSKKMVDDFGDKIKPHLLEIFRDSKAHHEAAQQELDPERKTPQEIALKRLRTVIEDQVAVISHRLDTKEVLPERGTLKYPEDLEKLRKHRDDLNIALRAITKRPDLTLEQRIKIATQATERSIKELERRVKEGDLSVRTAQKVETPELKVMREKRDGLQKQLSAARKAARTGGTTPEERATKAALKATEKSIATLQHRLIQNALSVEKTPSKVVETPELKALRDQRAALRTAVDEMVDANKERRDPMQVRLERIKKSLTSRTGELDAKLAAGDLSKKPGPTPLDEDAELLRLRADHQRAKDAFDHAVEKDRLANRPTARKIADTFVAVERAMKLTGIGTLAKLSGAAGVRVGVTPLEEAVGGIYSKLPVIGRVAARAPREGGINLRAELAALGGFKKGAKQFGRVVRSGRSDLDVLHGKREITPHRPILDLPGGIHGAIKTPVKYAEFERSYTKRAAFYRRQGLDTDNPIVKARIATESYRDAQRAIFMQDNFLSTAYNRGVQALERDGGNASYFTAKAARFLLPIVKVPTNVIGESLTYATGLETGSIRLMNAMRKGLDTLPPEQADLIMRELKKGSLGTGLLALGFFGHALVGGQYQQGEKRDKNELKPGNLAVPKELQWMLGKQIDKSLLHAPAFEILNMGSTIWRIAHEMDRKTGELKGESEGAWAALAGIIKEVPYIRTSSGLEEMLTPHGDRQRGDFLRSSVVPLGVQDVAKAMDQKTPDGEPVKRTPRTVAENVKMGIPGLRQTVPLATGTKEERTLAQKLRTPLQRRLYELDQAEQKKRDAKARELKRKLALSNRVNSFMVGPVQTSPENRIVA